jgi:hypothetical protein
MRVAWFGLLGLSLTVAACGHGSTATTISVTCGGATALVGAKYVDVLVDPASKSTILSFPDPINEDRTGTIVVQRKCTVGPTTEAR